MADQSTVAGASGITDRMMMAIPPETDDPDATKAVTVAPPETDDPDATKAVTVAPPETENRNVMRLMILGGQDQNRPRTLTSLPDSMIC